MPTVCRYWLQGRCRYGAHCKNIHDQNYSKTSGNVSQIPFHVNQSISKISLNPQTLQLDLTVDRPIWVLSCYSPLKDLSTQVISGTIYEQSPEETRLLFYLTTKANSFQAAIDTEVSLFNQHNAYTQKILRDPKTVCDYLKRPDDTPQNRNKICAIYTRAGQPGCPVGVFDAPRYDVSGQNTHSMIPQEQLYFAPATVSTSSFVNPFSNPNSNKLSLKPDNSSISNPEIEKTQQYQTIKSDNLTFFNQSRNSFATPSRSLFDSNQSSASSSANKAKNDDFHVRKTPESKINIKNDSAEKPELWNGHRVIYVDNLPHYKDSEGNLRRIIHLKPPDKVNPTCEPTDEEIAQWGTEEELRELYEYVRKHGKFKDGIMPPVPPKHDWIDWNV